MLFRSIHDTIAALIADRIRVSIIGLSAQVAICAELCSRTNGGDDSTYAVVLHEHHFRELFLKATTPPPTLKSGAPVTAAGQETVRGEKAAAATNGARDSSNGDGASLLMMGFPSRALAARDRLAVCACHNKPSREGYACTRCRSKVCRLPAECPACGLTLILSTHLARSYHHLFPLRIWAEVPWRDAAASRDAACFSCLAPFPTEARGVRAEGGRKEERSARAAAKAKGQQQQEREQAPPEGVSESGRYRCTVCGNHFCIDCDVFAHEVIHNCPGCQSDTRGQGRVEDGEMEVEVGEQTVAARDAGNGLNANGHSRLKDDMGNGQPDGFLAAQMGGT